MRAAILASLLILPTLAVAASPSIVERADGLEYRSSDGKTMVFAAGATFRGAVLSPDGRTVAYVRVLKPQTPERDGEAELWIADGPTGIERRLVRSQPSSNPEHDLQWFDGPIFSADGRFVYVTAVAWGAETAVHRVDTVSGRERFAFRGSLVSVVRNGPYRGCLLVRRHTAWPKPQTGYHYPVFVVRPNGQVVMRVPKMNRDDHLVHVSDWLSAHGWMAW